MVAAKTPIIPVTLITRPMMIFLFTITDLPLLPRKSLFAQDRVLVRRHAGAPLDSIASSPLFADRKIMECETRLRHSPLTFAAVMIGVQRAISLLTSAASGC